MENIHVSQGVTPEMEEPDIWREWEKFHKGREFRGGAQPVSVDTILRQVSVVLPEDLMEKWDEVKDAKGGDLAEYIINLIRKDLEGR